MDLSGHNALRELYVDKDGILVSLSRVKARLSLPFTRVLATLQRLDLLGESPFLRHHFDALIKIIAARGGLEGLSFIALPALISA